MKDAWIYIAGFAVVMFVSSVIISIRNCAVLRYRLKLIEMISQANKEDIEKRYYDKLDSRWKAFEEVSYYKMVFLFWRKFDSFYPIPPQSL